MKSSVEPMNLEAEARVIGSLLISPDYIPLTMANLSTKDFHGQLNAYIYDSICKLDMEGTPVSPEIIYQQLSKTKLPNGKVASTLIQGPKDIVDYANGVDVDEIVYWSEEVKNKSGQRTLLEWLEKSRERVLTASGDIKSLRSTIEAGLVSLGGDKSPDSAPISANMDQLYNRINKYIDDPDSITGMQSGWRQLDEVVDGFQKGNVSIVYAPTSRFKSLWTANLGFRFAEQGVPGLWFTTEMPTIQVKERVLQLMVKRNIKWMRRDKTIGKYRDEISLAIERMKDLPIYFNDTSSLNISDIRADVSRHKRWNGIDYVIIDLIDHVYSSMFKDEMVNNQKQVMQGIKKIAKDFDVHVIVVAHVRKGEKELKNSVDLDVDEISGSAAKSQDVDVSISLMPVAFDPEEGEMKQMSRRGIMEAMFDRRIIEIMVSVTKNRHGELFNMVMELDLGRGGHIETGVNLIEKNPYLEKRQQKQFGLTLAAEDE